MRSHLRSQLRTHTCVVPTSRLVTDTMDIDGNSSSSSSNDGDDISSDSCRHSSSSDSDSSMSETSSSSPCSCSSDSSRSSSSSSSSDSERSTEDGARSELDSVSAGMPEDDRDNGFDVSSDSERRMEVVSPELETDHGDLPKDDCDSEAAGARGGAADNELTCLWRERHLLARHLTGDAYEAHIQENIAKNKEFIANLAGVADTRTAMKQAHVAAERKEAQDVCQRDSGSPCSSDDEGMPSFSAKMDPEFPLTKDGKRKVGRGLMSLLPHNSSSSSGGGARRHNFDHDYAWYRKGGGAIGSKDRRLPRDSKIIAKGAITKNLKVFSVGDDDDDDITFVPADALLAPAGGIDDEGGERLEPRNSLMAGSCPKQQFLRVSASTFVAARALEEQGCSADALKRWLNAEKRLADLEDAVALTEVLHFSKETFNMRLEVGVVESKIKMFGQRYAAAAGGAAGLSNPFGELDARSVMRLAEWRGFKLAENPYGKLVSLGGEGSPLEKLVALAAAMRHVSLSSRLIIVELSRITQEPHLVFVIIAHCWDLPSDSVDELLSQASFEAGGKLFKLMHALFEPYLRSRRSKLNPGAANYEEEKKKLGRILTAVQQQHNVPWKEHHSNGGSGSAIAGNHFALFKEGGLNMSLGEEPVELCRAYVRIFLLGGVHARTAELLEASMVEGGDEGDGGCCTLRAALPAAICTANGVGRNGRDAHISGWDETAVKSLLFSIMLILLLSNSAAEVAAGGAIRDNFCVHGWHSGRKKAAIVALFPAAKNDEAVALQLFRSTEEIRALESSTGMQVYMHDVNAMCCEIERELGCNSSRDAEETDKRPKPGEGSCEPAKAGKLPPRAITSDPRAIELRRAQLLALLGDEHLAVFEKFAPLVAEEVLTNTSVDLSTLPIDEKLSSEDMRIAELVIETRILWKEHQGLERPRPELESSTDARICDAMWEVLKTDHMGNINPFNDRGYRNWKEFLAPLHASKHVSRDGVILLAALYHLTGSNIASLKVMVATLYPATPTPISADVAAVIGDGDPRGRARALCRLLVGWSDELQREGKYVMRRSFQATEIKLRSEMCPQTENQREKVFQQLSTQVINMVLKLGANHAGLVPGADELPGAFEMLLATVLLPLGPTVKTGCQQFGGCCFLGKSCRYTSR